MLIVNKLTKYYGADLVLKDISFSIGERDHLAIIGNNGAGKTTLLKAISGETDHEGNIELVGGFKNIGWLKQEIDEKFLEDTVFDFIEKGRNLKCIEDKINQTYISLSRPDISEKEEKILYGKIEELQNIFEQKGGYTIETDITKLAIGCGVNDILNYKLKELSGGQKSRVAFTQLLYSNPDVLLLDEPTNHLDKATKDWIMDYINNYRGAVISVSHDEEYLRATANKILMIDDKTRTGELFTNTYDEFLDIIRLRDEYFLKTFRNQMKKIEKVEAFIQKMEGTSGKRKKQAQSREKMLEKMKAEMIIAPQKSKKANISFDVETSTEKSPLSVSGLFFSYGSHTVLKNIDFSVYPNERFIIVGKNGAGKTTLLKLLNGLLKPQKGNINIWSKAIIGYYAQEQENILNFNRVIDEVMCPQYTEKQIRSILGRFNFSGDKVFQEVKTLSPGERSRLALLKLCMKKPNLMLLDEPTNHLDLVTKKILADALKDYQGTILMVSHDLEFLGDFKIDRMLMLPSGRIQAYDKDIVNRYYQEELMLKKDRKI
ncbi:MAG: ABC-F family ATP-binding cassette domain-containing protein [Alphaproteobacteria bacterium]|nr:ABC-F family ATP-binding cassette domain-containing protein [Alphaproteobacteria bacterium]